MSQRIAEALIKKAETMSTTVTNQVDSYMAPMRKTAFERFPLLFSFLVTFGVTATFFGIEKILADVDIFTRFPLLILLIGIATLAFTGTLYKKLM